MKVYVFPADLTGCGYYRLIWPALELKRQGHDVEIVYARNRDEMLQARVDPHGRVVSVKLPQDADVVVFQRVTHRFLMDAIPVIRASGIAVVVDMDDDLTCIHPANPAFHMLHPRGPNSVHSWQNTLTACDSATLVTVSTDALLARYARRRPGHVLHNCVPERYLTVEHRDSDVVGWAGSVHSHPTDLQEMGSAVTQVMQLGGKLRIAGPESGVRAALALPDKFEFTSTGIIDNIEAWPLAVNSLGIGLAPLADSKFNKAKSWLKPLEYAAVGVPCIVSPRPEYVKLVKRGIGSVAKSPNEWRRQIRALIVDVALRRERSEMARFAAEKLTIEKNAWRWLETWSSAYDLERSRVPAARSVR